MTRSTSIKLFLVSIGLASLVAVVGIWRDGLSAAFFSPASGTAATRVIGPVAVVRESESELEFRARVDTGAKTCSLHVAEWSIDDSDSAMASNIGKPIQFRTENHAGESAWVERLIADVRTILTSEGAETRYLVPMIFKCQDVEREVLVSLNDRSKMTYPMLLGRNFLAGEFVVDVASKNTDQQMLAYDGR